MFDLIIMTDVSKLSNEVKRMLGLYSDKLYRMGVFESLRNSYVWAMINREDSYVEPEEDLEYRIGSERDDIKPRLGINLVVCEDEVQAKRVAKDLHETTASKYLKNVVCLEGYDGKHYFTRCIRAQQSMEKSLEQIMDMIILPKEGMFRFWEFCKRIQGTGNYVIGMEEEAQSMLMTVTTFFQNNKVIPHMLYMQGKFDLDTEMKIREFMAQYPDVKVSARMTEDIKDKMEVVIVYSK